MTYDNYQLSKPVRLYIKQCSHCSLKYFGKTQSANIDSYQGSGLRWSRHLAKHNARAVTLWTSDWYYDSSIIRFATKFSNINRIVESPNWANIAVENGLQGGHLGDAVYSKVDIEKRVIKYKNTVHNKDWKDTTGAARIKKTKQNTDWNALSAKVSKTKQSDEWKRTTGIESRKRMSERKKDIVWQTKVGAAAIRKTIENRDEEKMAHERSKRMLNPEWRKQHHKTCEHCGKTVDPMNFGRWHGLKCKEADL